VGVYDGTAIPVRDANGVTVPFEIGASDFMKFFDGVIGEVAVYDHPLSLATAVQAHFLASGR
jgi:hypothetical protein